MAKYSGLETLQVTVHADGVVHVLMNRPKKLNAMNIAFWKECRDTFAALARDPDCRAIVVSGAGRAFTAGLDLVEFGDFFTSASSSGEPGGPDAARASLRFRNTVLEMQQSFTAIEQCSQPVIAAVHGLCIGGGIDMISACDIRLAAPDAVFCIKEVDIGLAADVGTLQRMPKVVGNDSLVRELAYTGRNFSATEAASMGFVSRVVPDVLSAAMDLARVIASKSPVAVTGTKVNLLYARDHSVPQSLQYVATWNSAMINTEDIAKAVQAAFSKETPVFSKL